MSICVRIIPLYISAHIVEDICWREACNEQDGCDLASLYCGSSVYGNNTFLQDACPTNGDANIDPIFGIYLPVLQNVSQSTGFFPKLFYCFWWGLQNLWCVYNWNQFFFTLKNSALGAVFICCYFYCSSYGQNLKTSTYIWENLFAVFVSTSGLVLFALLIGNVQV